MLINKRIQSRWSRLAAMNRHELMDRTREELGKRCDALRYRLGSNFAIDHLKLQPRTSSKFFFGSADGSSLMMRLRERLPQETAQIIERAERSCRHRLDLLGYEDLDYGADIDWHSGLLH